VNLRQVIEIYLQGWEFGDGALSLSATADSFCYNDPNTGRIARHEFVQSVDDFKPAAVEMGAAAGALHEKIAHFTRLRQPQ
jgi:hypothetical protein